MPRDLPPGTIGLRSHPRDVRLCARLGDDDLELPSSNEVSEVFATHLHSGPDVEVETVRLEYARWKPAVSALGTWSLTCRGGMTRVVTAKRYRDDDKPRALAGRHVTDRHLAAALDGERPLAVDLERHLVWRNFPADFALPGLPRAVRARRAARLVQDALDLGELALRKRRARVEIVRYKPERRAVLRFEAPLRGKPGVVLAGLRVHPPERAVRIAARREVCAAAESIGPRLLALDPSAGVLLEEWLPGSPALRQPSDAPVVGALLARLHAEPLGSEIEGRRESDKDLTPWFERVSGLAQAASRVAAVPRLGKRCWIHGDVHGEQLWITPTGPRLLDLDDLELGDPLDDLADWVADAVRVRSVEAVEEAGSLLEAYSLAGGARVEWAQLRPYVALALVRFAASALRRLEVGAEQRARRLVDRALELPG